MQTFLKTNYKQQGLLGSKTDQKGVKVANILQYGSVKAESHVN